MEEITILQAMAKSLDVVRLSRSANTVRSYSNGLHVFVAVLQHHEIDPENSSYLDSLGWAYFKLGKYESAETSLKKAAKLDPMSPTILDHLGDTYQKLGKPELARQNWQRALTFATDPVETEKLRTKLALKKAK